MIVDCPCGNKKFNLDASLIPNEGRLLQCGTCDRKWHYQLPLDTVNNIEKNLPKNNVIINKEVKLIKNPVSEIIKSNNNNKLEKRTKSISFLSLLSLIIISFLALIILLDTFKYQVDEIIPNFNSYLLNLYVTINDIYLFFLDLIR